MTNQEAIEHIKTIKIYSYYDGYTDEAREALDMAISALKAQDLQPICNQLATDCISRHDAISRIQNAYMDTHEGTDRKAVNINVGLTKALHIVQDMPYQLSRIADALNRKER